MVEAFVDPELSLAACVANRDEPLNAHFYASRTVFSRCSRSALHSETLTGGSNHFLARYSPGVELLAVWKRADVVIPDIIPYFDCAHTLLWHESFLNEDVV